MKKFLITISIGLIAVIIGDIFIGKALNYFYFKNSSGLLKRTTHSINETTADFLIFGSSRANHHYDVKIIEDSTGLTAYNTGRDGNFIFYQTAVLKAILERHTPKQIILDFTGTFENRQEDYDRLSSLLPYYKTHKELRSIIELKSSFERFKMLSNIYPYNSLLTTIFVGNLEINKNRKNNKSEYKGYVPLQGVWGEPIDSLVTSNRYKVDVNKINVFEDFIRLSVEKEINTIVIFSPVYYLYYKDLSIDICKRICEKYNVRFVDYSKDIDFLNSRELFKDKVHLNPDGAKLLTEKVLNEIKKIET